MVERDEDVIFKAASLCITGNEDRLILAAAPSVSMEEEPFIAMCQAGAKYFGKRFKVEDIPYACPRCGGEEFKLVQFLADDYVYQCQGCGISGPATPIRANAPALFKETFDEHR